MDKTKNIHELFAKRELLKGNVIATNFRSHFCLFKCLYEYPIDCNKQRHIFTYCSLYSILSQAIAEGLRVDANVEDVSRTS